jgi:CO/xanthine dehydrogenase FAD-binding subunit
VSVTIETYNTIAEADAALGSDGCFIAGGTLVMRELNYARNTIGSYATSTNTSGSYASAGYTSSGYTNTGSTAAGNSHYSRVLRVNAPPREIRAQGDRVQIDAAVTMADILASRDVEFLAPVARAVGGPAVRNMATVGGNLFAPHPYGDFATALLALQGEVHYANGRTQALDSFFLERDRAPLVASVSVRVPRHGEFRFRKVSRVKPKGVSVMSIAAWLPGAPSSLSQVRIAFGAMGPTPLRATAAEQALERATLDSRGIERALGVTTQGLSPMDDALASAWYRMEVAPVHLRRLLLNEEPGA